MTLKDNIEEIAGGERIEAIVIGGMGWGDYGSDRVPSYASIPKGVILTWEEGSKWLDYEYDEGFGSPGCNCIYAWTENKIIFISQYDGATDVESIPRHPVACMPTMPGG